MAAHDNAPITIELVDCEAADPGDRKIKRVAFSQPKDGWVPIPDECRIILIQKSLGEFPLDFELSACYFCSTYTCMHNTYVFFSSDDETKIGVTISVGYEDGKGLCFSSAQFYKMDEGDCECGINHGDDEAHEDDDEQHGLAEALDELKVTDK